MEALRLVDEVAFVRFASVYRKFTDAADFIQEIQELKK
jgi:transcriptional repressor NrdR